MEKQTMTNPSVGGRTQNGGEGCSEKDFEW